MSADPLLDRIDQGGGTEAQMRRVLSLVADSAIDADDAIIRKDADGLNKAIEALMLNAGIAQKRALAWRPK